ncbi:MAG: hypothetical protein LC733_03415 [Actinobacteria bacterium]|nr:hypothetical protein [Actinomycetota bacterium]
MTKAQKILPVFVMVVILLAVGWSLLPFEFTRGVGCGAPLLGAKPDNATPVGLIQPEKDCKSKAKSRLLVSAMISLAAAGVGTAAIALKPISLQCLGGNHDDCPYAWGNFLSDNFEGLGCQCECHTDEAL